MSSPFCDVIERRACETFKNYRQHYVISRHVGGLLGDVSWQPFLFLESPGVGQFFYLRMSPISTQMCAKFGCGPTVVSKKREGGTDRHTYRQTDKGTLQLYIVDYLFYEQLFNIHTKHILIHSPSGSWADRSSSQNISNLLINIMSI